MNETHPPRRHGFRLSAIDGIILLLGSVLTIWLRNESFPLWWVVPMALGHFFLFCNVFLVWRRWELLWAAFFVMNAALHLVFGMIDGISVLLWQLPLTLLVIVWQVRSPWYHGIFAEKLNPQLTNYLSGDLTCPKAAADEKRIGQKASKASE